MDKIREFAETLSPSWKESLLRQIEIDPRITFAAVLGEAQNNYDPIPERMARKEWREITLRNLGKVEMQDFNEFCTQWNNAAFRVGSRTPGEEHALFLERLPENMRFDCIKKESKVALDNPALRLWGLYNPTIEGVRTSVTQLIGSEPRRVELGASNTCLVVFKNEEQREKMRTFEGMKIRENGQVLRMQNDLAELPVATLQEFLKRKLAASYVCDVSCNANLMANKNFGKARVVVNDKPKREWTEIIPDPPPEINTCKHRRIVEIKPRKGRDQRGRRVTPITTKEPGEEKRGVIPGITAPNVILVANGVTLPNFAASRISIQVRIHLHLSRILVKEAMVKVRGREDTRGIRGEVEVNPPSR